MTGSSLCCPMLIKQICPDSNALLDRSMSSPSFTSTSTAEEVAAAFSKHIKGKTVLITGTTVTGLGFAAANVIAKEGGLVILTGRSEKKLRDSEEAIKADFPAAKVRKVVLDLSSRASVRKAASEVLAYPETLDVLVNNATPELGPLVLVDNLDSQFAIGHVNHFLLTKLLAPKLLASPAPRVVVMSSGAQARGRLDWDLLPPGKLAAGDLSKYSPLDAYRQLKLANVLFAKELSRRSDGRLPGYSLHPGVVHTGIDEHPESMKTMQAFGAYTAEGKPNLDGSISWKTRSQGAATTIVAAFDPSLAGQGGSYLADSVLANEQINPFALDEANTARLWEITEYILGEKFTF
ncbi:Short-chain dehydrogenase/reductase family protein [Mycena kentingensis (nom. inval.)]|nr:Short-chain dehydrogenase/reductase family protein [Mycena kentingensis (nom. inval.)]